MSEFSFPSFPTHGPDVPKLEPWHPIENIVSGNPTHKIYTVRDIAREVGVDEGDVSRFLPLAFLAPDIVEAMRAGRQPVELTPEKLKRLRILSKSWQEQRQLLGFTG